MTYRVIVTDPAFDAIQAQARYIAIEQQAPEAAQRWLERVFDASDTLAEMPYRCALAAENDFRPYEIRWLGVGDFMLLFTVVEESKTVWVIGARHGRRLPRPASLPSKTPGKA